MDLNELIIGCKNNDRKAQKAFVDHFSKYLFAISKRYMRDDEEAKDVLQDSFVSIFNNIAEFRSDAQALKSWTRQITINSALQRIRKSYRDKEIMTDTIVDDRNESPEIYGKMGAEEIMVLINQLPQMYSQVFNMYVIDGYSHKEISDMIGVQESSSRAILTRAKKMIRDKIFEIQKMAI
ncbi:MAG: RNA polymerase sigma factor [Saprospiraceae bacterium]|nr:RNA polymerase sigma factor [Saprospiraceae bacterium]